jgi:arylsulfatase
MRGAKASLYDGGHRVPCFLRWPGGDLRAPSNVPALTRGQDMLPTLIDLCGLDKPPSTRFDGISLEPLLRGDPQPELADRISVVQYGGLVQTDPQPWDAAVLQDRWRLVNGTELYDIRSDLGQEKNVAEAHPDIVGRLRAYYETWWAEIQPQLDDFERICIGSDRENPARLSSLDWLVPTLTIAAQPFDVRLLGRTKVVEGSLPLGRPQPALNGPWNVTVERGGRYQIALRRWPAEADAAITAGLPPYEGVDGTFPAGTALPVARARLAISTVDVSKPVRESDKSAVFTVDLAAGPAKLQTWFYDEDGKELCGAFYVTVRRLQGP